MANLTGREIEKVYKIVENYWTSVKRTWPEEWKNNKSFKLMTNTPGLSALGRVGGILLDSQLPKEAVKVEDLTPLVAQMKPLVDWESSSEIMKGMAGPGAAKKIAEDLEKIVAKSKLTEADAEAIGNKIKARLRKRYYA